MNTHLAALTSLLLTSAVVGQIQMANPVPLAPLRLIERAIPAELGAGNALRCVSFDPDADLLHDVAILWSSGEVVFGYAPEILGAFVRLPVTGATAITRVPGVGPSVAGQAGDRLLATTATGLQILHFDRSQVGSAAWPAGFVGSPITVPPSWQSCLRVDSHWDGTNCWLLAVDGDLHTVRMGLLVGDYVLSVGTASTTHPVRQMLAVDETGTGALTFVARTTGGLHFWDSTGATVAPMLPADSVGPSGGLAVVRQAGETRLAWLVQNGSHWRVRTVRQGASIHLLDIADSPEVPARFRPTGIAAVPSSSGDDSLVIGQNTTTNQLVLSVDPSSGCFATAHYFSFTGLTANVDNCPPTLDDMNNDGRVDFVTTLSSAHRLQIATDLRPAASQPAGNGNAMAGPTDVEQIDFLPVDCELIATQTANDTIAFAAEIPAGTWPTGLHVQVVAWSQTVFDPSGALGAGYQAQILDDLVRNQVYPVSVGANGLRPRLILSLDEPASGIWTPDRHHYFMIRLVAIAGGSFTWSSPAQFVGLVANQGEEPTNPGALAYLTSISTGGGDKVRARGSNRNVGVVLKPDRIAPPSSTLKPPAPGNAVVQPPPSNW